jgi:predicted amidohydrolase YtcJ
MPLSRVSIAAGALAFTIAGVAPVLAQPADAIFVNGKVFTADPAATVAPAFAVRGDRFLAVGSNDQVRALAGPQTRVVDLKGAFVTPGLTDSHFHSEGGGAGVDLSKTKTVADVLAAVAERARIVPAGEVIVSNGDWHENQLAEKRLPHARELDTAAPDHPVVLVRGGHEFILNSAALRKWNITTATVSPTGGRIGLDETGALNGELIDAAKGLITLPPPPRVGPDDVLRTQKVLNSYGITSIRIPGRYRTTGLADNDMSATIGVYRTLRTMADAGQLTMRVNHVLRGVTVPGRSIETLQRVTEAGIKPNEGDEWVRNGGIKFLVDGGFEGGHYFEPYAEPWGKGGTYRGVVILPQPEFLATIRALDRAGWRVNTHAAGDAGLEQVLDAYEAVNAESPITQKRWAIEHAFLASPEQIARVKALGLHVTVQNHLQIAAPAFLNYLGAPRTERITPLKSYMDAGLNLSGGTDSEIAPVNPFWELYHFLTRETRAEGVRGPGEAVTDRAALLKLVTVGFASLTGETDIKGSIAPGKLADFAVLSDDFLTVAPARVLDMKALATFVGGREVYRDPAWR